MAGEGDALRAQLREVGRIKAETCAEDVERHLALPLGERLRRVIDLSQQCIAASRHLAEERDDELDAWARVQARLRERVGSERRE
jgi:hypothetical protein